MINQSILILLISSYIMAAPAQLCASRGSILNTYCTSCYKSALVNKECLTNYGKMIENCLVTEDKYRRVDCRVCDHGYAFDTSLRKCVTSKIKNCEVERVEQFTRYCYACNNGLPDFQATTCPGGSGLSNCMWPGGSSQYPECYRCNPGYSVINGKCKVSPIEGCMIMSKVEKKYCESCNYYEGYFSLKDRRSCQKKSK